MPLRAIAGYLMGEEVFIELWAVYMVSREGQRKKDERIESQDSGTPATRGD
jgi:hypothetical protein